MQASDRELQGELRITAPTTFAEMHLLPIISRYAKDSPGVRVRLDLTDRFVNLVEERVDLAIRIGALEESSLVSRRIGETRLLLCASPEFVDRHGLPQTPDQLPDYPCIVDSNNPHGASWTLSSAGAETVVRVEERLSVNNARAARDLVIAGNGIGLLPSFVVDGHLDRGELLPVLAEYSSSPIGIYAVYLHRKHLSPRVRKLVDLLVEAWR